jgi:hypothetical protein
MMPAIQREVDSERRNRSRLITDHRHCRRPSATSNTDSLAPGFSDDGANGRMDNAEEDRQNLSSIKSTDFATRMFPAPSHEHGSDRHSIYHMTNPRGALSRDQRLDCRQSGIRAWLSTPQAYEVGVGRKQRDGDIYRLYTMVQEVGLDTRTGKNDRDLQRNAALQPRPTAAEERRRLELAGVGACTDTNAIARVR